MLKEEKKMAEDVPMSSSCDSGGGLNIGISHSEARKGLIKTLLSHSVAKRFTSKPFDLNGDRAAVLQSFPSLTQGEQEYLESLLRSEDEESIHRASITLSDRNLFPTEVPELIAEQQQSENGNRQILQNRNSHVQQVLFRMHEKSQMNRRVMSSTSRKDSILESCPSIIDNGDDTAEVLVSAPYTTERENGENLSRPVDVPSWIEDQEFEVTDGGSPLSASDVQYSFAILGTTADDTSCHPHVLSPPLMESILEFVPETLSNHNFWIKFSLARDGPSLWTLMRHARASSRTILAIETSKGHIFGAFTSSPWRLSNSSNKLIGSKDSLLWKMRRPRLASQEASLREVLMMESELIVFPYTGRNTEVQHCGVDGIGFGEERNAIQIDVQLHGGTTAPSETFGNPCLTDAKKEKDNFEIANLEVWTLTPKHDVKEAERAELSTLFLEGQMEDKKLDLLGILIGGSPK